MDPLSISASIIAVVGAAATVTKELEKLRRALREAPDTVCALINEVSDFNLVLGACQSAVTDLTREDVQQHQISSEAATIVLDKARRHLSELGRLAASCVKPVANGPGAQQSRVARLRWLKASGAAKKLQQKLQASKQEILMILEANSASAVSDMRLTIEGFSVGTHQFQAEASNKLDDILKELKQQAARMEHLTTMDRGLMAQLRTASISATNEEITMPDSGYLTPSYLGCRTPSDLDYLTTSDLEHLTPSDYASMEHRPESISIRASSYRKCCQAWCSCRCHNRQTIRSPSSKMIKSFLGSLFVGYSGVPGITPTCNEARCKKRATTRVVFNYQFPNWFWTKVLSTSFATDTMPGPELLLRVQSVVPFTSPTYQFCVNGSVTELKTRFDNGLASPWDHLPDGWSLLNIAVYTLQRDMCRLLISYGADIFHEDHTGYSAHHRAWDVILFDAQNQTTQKDLLELFPQEEGGLDERQFSRIHKCVLGLIGADLSTELSVSTSSINALDDVGRTPLYWAARRGDLHSVTLLLDFGADVNKAGYQLVDRPLHAAAKSGDVSILRSLLNNPAVKLDELGESSLSALHKAACYYDGNGCVEMLIDAGAEVDLTDPDGRTPFLGAIQNGMVKNAAALLQGGADINVSCESGWTALLSCVFWNEHDSVQLLLDRGAAFDTKTCEGDTILHFAATFANQRMLDVLCGSAICGLDAEAKAQAGETARDIAEARDDVDEQWRASFEQLVVRATRTQILEDSAVAQEPLEATKGGDTSEKMTVQTTELDLGDGDEGDVFHDALDVIVSV